MTKDTIRRQLSITRNLQEEWAASAIAYGNYLQHGRTYLLAKQLKKHNDKVRSLLADGKALFNEALQHDIALLLEHYEAWTAKWLALQEQISPADGDLFVFENDIRFPRAAAANLQEEHVRLQQLVD